jgi:putative membrane protein
MADTDFINTASQANLAEIAAGRVAAKKAGSRAVQAFADSMVSDHTQAQSELAGIAGKEGVALVQSVDTEHARTNERLAGLSGPTFDSAYMNGQLLDHQAAIQLFQQESSLGRDSLARIYATKYLPKLRHHLEMAQQLRGR